MQPVEKPPASVAPEQRLPVRPVAPTDLTDDAAVAEYKAQLRAWDRKVIAEKLLTAREVNELNSIFTRVSESKFKILNLEEALLSQR
jgi:hypothetical protein